jgi:hypothetical protein
MGNMRTIVDSDNNEVSLNFLYEVLEISNSEADFLKKVNYGISEEEDSVSYDNDQNIIAFYRNEKSLEFVEVEIADAVKAQEIFRDGNWKSLGVTMTSSNVYYSAEADILDEFVEQLNDAGIKTIPAS